MNVLKNINWSVRILNPTWWIAMVPAVCLLIQTVGQLVGLNWEYTDLAEKLRAIIDATFSVLVLIGVNTDVTTNWLADSARAQTYEKPAPNAIEQPIAHIAKHMGGE